MKPPKPRLLTPGLAGSRGYNRPIDFDGKYTVGYRHSQYQATEQIAQSSKSKTLPLLAELKQVQVRLARYRKGGSE
jgi:hypothetical protein